ncbi:hypothetical protein CEXT_104631 [Caerostris extrusa]|uniref:Uncharacterized protein n=1 Tax=Caerostris extrusa TaxID=172846 RepID=A0AAV4QUI2_CAEEX|nr:hypothetical protein CEXT_104631 [Caerostris extrusa]
MNCKDLPVSMIKQINALLCMRGTTEAGIKGRNTATKCTANRPRPSEECFLRPLLLVAEMNALLPYHLRNELNGNTSLLRIMGALERTQK